MIVCCFIIFMLVGLATYLAETWGKLKESEEKSLLMKKDHEKENL